MRSLLFLAFMVLVSCKPSTSSFTAQQIIDKSIVAAGGDRIINSYISFEFRNRLYSARRNNGAYSYERVFKKDSSTIKDVLYNDGFERYINSELVQVADSMAPRYSNSVNSVHYFSVLPFGLNDGAVYKKLIGTVKIKEIEYYKIKVTFSEEGGGKDFDDVFLYWIRKDNFKTDYIAYKYFTDGGGMRFRDIKDESIVNGLRFVNYNNYKPIDKSLDFMNIDKVYESNQLKKLSEIILENVDVEFF